MQNQNNIIDKLIEEYPFLINQSLKIERQFVSESSRVYNTYLVKSNYSGFKEFVAKGSVLEKYSLKGEWQIIKLLKTKNFPCAQLLVPDHEPVNLLLLKYISGKKASERLLEKKNASETFFSIGELTGKLHTLEVSWFGNLEKNKNINWVLYSKENLRNRLAGSRKIIQYSLYKQTKDLLEDLVPIIESEKSEPPVLIHRDIYSDNFIIEEQTNKLYLIDYGMAIGGRPFYDLGKFYIFDLYHFPAYQKNFLSGYSRYINLPIDFNKKLKLYILIELLGCVNFFSSSKQKKALNSVIKILKELTSNKGRITKLINNTNF